MRADLVAVAGAALATLQRFDVDAHSPSECAGIVEALARLEKACAAVRDIAAARATDAGEHRKSGFHDPRDWLARQAGTSTADAERALETARKLDELPATRAALTSGEVSLDQANEVVMTVEQCGGAEQELLDTAKTQSLRVLKDRARERRLRAIDPNELHERQRGARFHRHWRDEFGMIRYSGAMMPSEGTAFMNRLDVATDREWRAANRAGRRERREQYAADAFAGLVAGTGKGHATRADVVFVLDVGSGACHVVGGGPVPVSTVRAAAKDAFAKAVLHDGTKVDTIAHYGRKWPALLRTVLELGDPPHFNGMACVDCGRVLGLERDHIDPVANGGITSKDNTDPRCRPCHVEKTKRDVAAGLITGVPRARGQPP